MNIRAACQEFILSCKRKTLENLLKAGNLPIGGLKQELVLRLLRYIDLGPSAEFQAAIFAEMQAALSPRGLPAYDAQKRIAPSESRCYVAESLAFNFVFVPITSC